MARFDYTPIFWADFGLGSVREGPEKYPYPAHYTGYLRRLLIRPGAIGDVILSLPALEQAKAEFTEVWAPRNVLSLIRFADARTALPDTGLDWVGVVNDRRASPALRRLSEFDSIHSWYGSKHGEFREAVRHLPFTFFPALPPPPGVPRISVPPKPREQRVVIHPFASAPAKRWPLQNFEKVAAQLPGMVAWCAGPEEDLAQAQRFGDLYDLACWLSGAAVFMGNDSGIAHLAAAVGTPVVSIFLSTDPVVWAPRGGHVTVLQNPHWQQAFAAVRRYLG